ncbi:MAG: zinc ribbon domain-containing protein [Roseburia sp.]|nr:zinc ribbon domain-containing protein [Roseburia sp.]
MAQNKICKTIHQYNKEPIAEEDMRRLEAVAEDYRRVKNYVYQRYGGIKSLPKLYPGYTIQNEMTQCGLRAELGLPSVYFYLAVFEALGDIKTQWTRVKGDVLAAVSANERFTDRDRHYLRFVLKVSGCFDNILNGKAPVIPEEMKDSYHSITEKTDADTVDCENLNRYLCRQVRKRLRGLQADKAGGFAIAERAYRYGMNGKLHGIFISTKENRRRVFVPLTDGNAYKKQLYIKLKPEENGIELAVPIEVRTKTHRDYTNEVGLSVGIEHMFTTDTGTVYGKRFGELHTELAEYMSAANRAYRREKDNNAGRKKYSARKARLDAGLETYVNQEINRMIAQERPRVLYVPRLPQSSAIGYNRKINYSVTVWRKGFVRERLTQKCRENSIVLVEVAAKAISTECSRCGASGKLHGELFTCESCGYEADKKRNAAENALRRGKMVH